MGTAAQGLAIGWEMYDRTGQALSLGMVGLVQAIPMLLLTLPAGYLADVFDRRKLMMLSLAGATLASLALAAFSWYQMPVHWMYLLLFLDSSFLRLGWPAQRAIAPLLVPDALFENAAKWSTSLMQITGIAGTSHRRFCHCLQSPSRLYPQRRFFCSLHPLPQHHGLASCSAHPRGNMFAQIAVGLRFVRDQPLLLGAISLDLFAVLLGGAVYLLPIFAREIIDLGPVGLAPEAALGWLRAAPAIGATITALAIAHLPPIRRAGKTLLWCVVGFGAATILFGLSQNFWFSLLMLALTGAFDNVSMVIRRVISQMGTPNQMRGRVQAVSAIFVGSSNEIGGFESGLVAQLFNPVFSVVSGGIGTLLVVAAWTGLFPSLRNLGSLSSLTAQRSTPNQRQ